MIENRYNAPIDNYEQGLQHFQFTLTWFRGKIHPKGRFLEPRKLIKEISGEGSSPDI